ncbi:MAG: disulfide bond formation protein [Candidatus Midichloriaceae bacterium]|jgi:disulfide bond formation protein DsbB|nr:disulfide bond formation protein [Candidatus Midichloriaceae bacterium]
MNPLRKLFKLLLVFNIIALVASFSLEHYLDLTLCKLCYYQRYIFAAISAILIIAIIAKFFQNIAAVIIILLYLANSTISLTQVLAEEGLINKSTLCTGLIPKEAVDLEAFKSQILSNDFTPCDIEPKRFFGASLAGYSFVASTAMLIMTLVVVLSLFLFRYKGD